ncbi:glycosyl transferase group 1 [Polaribacter reichenbachii]|uniref:Glycosyl transferase group 1 n=1 Tax=Polaribacter reichenbachii TaxID=996801 RepID=A0A1B8TVT5_9FLAO|nr:glycosyltransferase [Polaribacter reichenbachii]APZ45135.1 glycosyl transferase group 1 [Polaribacter reichenbachii]AUC18997.1 glycosyl transferase group 1 [Polaribacter reichenbachii]OBY63846.1 glycosyl transferase group 1 [Polaribacter reichenbachii]
MDKKKIFVAVTNDISTDYRVHKICSYLISKKFQIDVYGRVLPNTINVNRDYKIIRKKHFFNNEAWFYAEFNIRLFFYLLFKKYDYILANDLDTLPACFFVSKLKNIELVYDSHELFSESVELQGRKFVKGFWRKLEDFFLPRIKKSYTVSQSIVNFYNDKYQNKMGLIRNIPLKKDVLKVEEVSFPTKNKTILYQGVLNPGRGIKPMIKALKYIEDLDLIIIGYGKVEEELKKFVIKHQLNNRVYFLGRVDRDKLFNYTKQATLGMVLEEPVGLSFQFSLPNKLFDYIHAGIPIIAGRLPEISRIISDFKVGVLVDDYQPETIAKTIHNLLEDKALLSKIKENQLKAKKVLCWEIESKKLDKFFK